jgi:hypothetical protein
MPWDARQALGFTEKRPKAFAQMTAASQTRKFQQRS